VTEPKEIDVVRRAYQLWQLAAEPLGKDENSTIKLRKSCKRPWTAKKTKAPARANCAEARIFPHFKWEPITSLGVPFSR